MIENSREPQRTCHQRSQRESSEQDEVAVTSQKSMPKGTKVPGTDGVDRLATWVTAEFAQCWVQQTAGGVRWVRENVAAE